MWRLKKNNANQLDIIYILLKLIQNISSNFQNEFEE